MNCIPSNGLQWLVCILLFLIPVLSKGQSDDTSTNETDTLSQVTTWEKDSIALEQAHLRLERQYFEYEEQENPQSLSIALEQLSLHLFARVFFFFNLNNDEGLTLACKRIAASLDRIAYAYEYNSEYHKAKEFYSASASFVKKRGYKVDRITSDYNMAYIHFYLHEMETADSLAKDIIKRNNSLSKPDLEIDYGCLGLLGDIRMIKKDFANAKKYFSMALSSTQERHGEKHPFTQYYHEGLANSSYKIGDYRTSIHHYEKAMEVTPQKDSKNILSQMIGMANAYSHTDAPKAKKLYMEALDIAELNHAHHRNNAKAQIFYQLGMLKNTSRQKSKQYFLMSKEHHLKSAIPLEKESDNFIALSNLYDEDSKERERYLIDAIKANLRRDYAFDINELPPNEAIIYPISLIACYEQLGKYTESISLEKALGIYIQAQTLSQQIKPTYQFEGSKSALTEALYPICEHIIRISYELYHQTNDVRYLQYAFQASEKTKSASLTDALNEYLAIEKTGISESLFQKGKELKSEMDFLKEQLNNADELQAEELRDINERLVALHTDYNEYLLDIEEKHPKYYQLKYSNNKINIEQLKKALRKSETLIEYHIQSDELYIFIIDAEQHQFIKKSIKRETLEQLIADLTESLYDKERNFSNQAAVSLYELLFEHIHEQHQQERKFIIIPDGILNNLSFEILGKDSSFYSRLIHDHIFRYDYSAQQLIDRSPSKRRKPKFLGIAPEYYSETFKELPFALEEVKFINECMGGCILKDTTASISSFKEKVKEHTILHIAGHTSINSEYPLQSKLIFSENPLVKFELPAHELYNMTLDLDMVTLSACNAGLGSLKKGEGSMSLARGFAYAGCPSTVSTLWHMSDRPTKEIMVKYYHKLQQGKNKSKALREAKLEFLDKGGPNVMHPFYWAGIVIIGSDYPIAYEPWYEKYAQYIFSALVLFIILGVYLNKKGIIGQQEK